MTAIPDKNILNGSSNPTTSQFKGQMGQLWDYLNERNDVNATASGLKVSTNKKLLGRNTSGAGAIEEITYSDQGYSMLTGVTQLGFRNKIVNGDMRIDQRNSGTSQTITAGAALAYAVDRFYVFCTGDNTTGQRVEGANANTFRYQFTGAASVTGIGIGTRLEAENTAMLAGTTTTLQCALKSSSLTSVTWTAYYATTKDSFGTLASPTRIQIATGTFTINTTETTYSTNISIPSAATTGIEIVFTAGALLGSQTLTITNIQLEVGSVATPFEYRPYSTELALCQRYYNRLSNTSGNAYYAAIIPASSPTRSVSKPVTLSHPLRSSPTITFNNVIIYNSSYSAVGLATTISTYSYVPQSTEITLDINLAGGLTVGNMYIFALDATTGYIDFSSEL